MAAKKTKLNKVQRVPAKRSLARKKSTKTQHKVKHKKDKKPKICEFC